MGLTGPSQRPAMSNTPIPYPRRLYPGGIVDHSDLFAKASIVVESAEEEDEARTKGFRKAYEVDSSGGNGGSEASAIHPTGAVAPQDAQGGAAPASADPLPDDEAVAEAALQEAAEAVAALDAKLDERESLRAEAVALGLTPHHKAGVAKLREMIAAAKG